MKSVAFVSCVKTKHPVSAPAGQIFSDSALFRLSYEYAKSLRPDAIFILSTEYGLLQPQEIINPYDRSPNLMNRQEWNEWAVRVMKRLSQVADPVNDKFIFVAGAKYSAALRPYIKHYELPLEGLTQGRRLQFLKAHGSVT